MLIKAKQFSPVGYTIYSIVGTILELVAIVVIVLWGLPRINIHIPLWGLILLMVASLLYSIFTYEMGKQVIGKKPVVDPETIIGNEGKVATLLDPRGYVKVKGELWKASCETRLDVEEEIVVVGIDGIKLIVVPRKEAHLHILRN